MPKLIDVSKLNQVLYDKALRALPFATLQKSQPVEVERDGLARQAFTYQ